MYDPDRATKSSQGGPKLTLSAVRDRLSALHEKHSENGGEGLLFLAEPSSSPSRLKLVKKIKKTFPKALWTEYSAIDSTGSERAAEDLLGKSLRSIPHFDKAKCILSLDCDFLSGFKILPAEDSGWLANS